MTRSSGWSGIFSFPFRILAATDLPQLDRMHRGRRFRIHKPFLLRPNGAPLTQSVPFRRWPNFQWCYALPPAKRIEPPQGLGVSLNAPVLYDGLRADCWGKGAENSLDDFVENFLLWLRRLSGQPWLGDVDRFFERSQKHQFAIDDSGAATDTPYSIAKAHVTGDVRLVTVADWRTAFDRTICQESVPAYWNTYYDGLNATARNDYPGAIMAMAMAIESARDMNLSRFVPHKFIPNVGFRLGPPFTHTNLLDHLSCNLRDHNGRDLSVERPDLWEHLKHLYIARHHVAHGKGAVFNENGQLRKVTEESFRPWPASVRVAIEWLESL